MRLHCLQLQTLPFSLSFYIRQRESKLKPAYTSVTSAVSIRSVASVSVYLTTAYSDPEPISGFLKAVQENRPLLRHTLVDDPAAADVILFVENSHYHADIYFTKLKNHPLVKQYPEKVYMYNPHDTPWLVLPGIYPSIPKPLLDSRMMASGSFIETINPYISCDFTRSPHFLFSFFGSPYLGVRKRVARLQHPRGEIRVGAQNMYGDRTGKKTPQVQYAELLLDSKFVLCPKGIAASSIRVLEVMQAGRAPVIISDNWVPPKGPSWNDFAVFVPEADIERIPQILEAQEAQWEQMGRRAREAWERYFAPGVVFNYMIDTILGLENLSTYQMPQAMRLAHLQAKMGFRFRLLRHQVKTCLKTAKLLKK